MQNPRIIVLGAGDERRFFLKCQDFRNTGLTHEARQDARTKGEDPPWFSNDWILVRVSYRSPRGATVEQAYEWSANFPRQHEPGVWTMLSMTIRPDAPGSEPILHRLS